MMIIRPEGPQYGFTVSAIDIFYARASDGVEVIMAGPPGFEPGDPRLRRPETYKPTPQQLMKTETLSNTGICRAIVTHAK